jgi:hypothetical protein
MASQKISDMTPATDWHAADIFPLVQSLMNLSATRPLFLRAVAGDEITIRTPNSSIGFDTAENFLLHFVSPKLFTISRGTDNIFTVSAAGQVVIAAPNDQNSYIGNTTTSYWRVRRSTTAANRLVACNVSGGQLFFQWSSTQVFTVDTSGNVTFRTPTGSDFQMVGFDYGISCVSGGVLTLTTNVLNSVSVQYYPQTPSDWSPKPTTHHEAIDRIAAVVAANFGPIP